MDKLDRALLAEVKRAFVPQPGGATEPVAGASQMTAGMSAPMGGPMGGDPAAMGGPMGGDPAAMGGGALPPAGLDPAMAGMMGGGAAPEQGMTGSSQLNLTVDDLIKLFKVFQRNSGGGGAPAAPAAAPAAASAPQGGDPRIDRLVTILEQALGQGGGGGGEFDRQQA